ncbi:MAG: hypothetical protein A4E48_00229 [Methanosaeta sp. PtaU1.Bin060]|nr:MAG: hypothetical protein A4E48_00229 [Methanosaeta sp. PtaU1.Bin060]
MATFTIAPPRDVRTARTGAVKTYIAGGRIPFGAAVIRAGAGKVKAAILEDTDLVIGFALEDEETHLYSGFYESGEPVPVALTGTVNGLMIAIDDYDLLEGDYLEVADITSGTNTSELGLLAEAGNHAGETKTLHTVAQLLEDLALKDETYKAPASTPTAGTNTIAMTSGDPTIMGLHVGDYILIRDSDGNAAGQVNRITAISDNGSTASLTVLIPISVAAADYVHAIRQAEVLIVK